MAGNNREIASLILGGGDIASKLKDLVKQMEFQSRIGDSPDCVIHKVELPWSMGGHIRVPQGARITAAAEQHGKIMAWYLYPVTAAQLPYQRIPIGIVATGQKFDDAFHQSMDFYRTVFMSNGEVWHVFVGNPTIEGDEEDAE